MHYNASNFLLIIRNTARVFTNVSIALFHVASGNIKIFDAVDRTVDGLGGRGRVCEVDWVMQKLQQEEDLAGVHQQV